MISPEINNNYEQLNQNEVGGEKVVALDKIDSDASLGENLKTEFGGDASINQGNVKGPNVTTDSIKPQKTVNLMRRLTPEERLKYTKNFLDLVTIYMNDASFGEQKEDFGKIRELLRVLYPSEYKNWGEKTPIREVESEMKKKAWECATFLRENMVVTEGGLTAKELNKLKEEELAKGSSSAYVFDGEIRYRQTGERGVKIKGSNIVGEWNFVAKDTNYNDLNTLPIAQDNVQKLATQLAQLRNNPNIDPSSIRIVINSSASNLKYAGGNDNLAKQRATNLQEFISSKIGDMAPQFEINSVVSGPVYPPTVEDLQRAGFNYNGIGLANIVASYQDVQINKALEEQLYRQYQKVEVSLDYEEIKEEPIYSVDKKDESIIEQTSKMPLNTCADLIIDKSLIEKIGPKNLNIMIDQIQDPKMKNWVKTSFLKNTVGKAVSSFRFSINTSFGEGSELFHFAALTKEADGQWKKTLGATSNLPLYQYKGGGYSVEKSKVPAREIVDADTLKELLRLIGDPNTTDKKLENFLKEKFF